MFTTYLLQYTQNNEPKTGFMLVSVCDYCLISSNTNVTFYSHCSDVALKSRRPRLFKRAAVLFHLCLFHMELYIMHRSGQSLVFAMRIDKVSYYCNIRARRQVSDSL